MSTIQMHEKPMIERIYVGDVVCYLGRWIPREEWENIVAGREMNAALAAEQKRKRRWYARLWRFIRRRP